MPMHTALDSSLTTIKAQTRAERRRLEKQQAKNKVTYNLTLEQLQAFKDEARNSFIKHERGFIEDIMFNALVIAMHDELGMGKVRINKVLNKAKEEIACLDQGYISKEELKLISESLQGKADKIR